MTSTSSRLSNLLISGFGCLLLADPTHHQTPPIHPQPPLPTNISRQQDWAPAGWQPAGATERKNA